jgi:hypothetical protein
LVEEGIDLKGIFLGQVAVRPGSDQTENVCQRRAGWIVGLEADIGVGKDRLLVRGKSGRPGQECGSEKRSRAKQEGGKPDAFEECPSGQERLFVALIWHGSREDS